MAHNVAALERLVLADTSFSRFLFRSALDKFMPHLAFTLSLWSLFQDLRWAALLDGQVFQESAILSASTYLPT